MTMRFVCHGCGATVDAALALPFRCPQAGGPGDDVDHLLVPTSDEASFAPGDEDDPFLRYRGLLSPYRLARAWGLSDAAWVDIEGALDDALIAVDGRGFRLTPITLQQALAAAAGWQAPLWVKDETGNVAGSHKARHLMGVMLYLRVLDAAGKPAAAGLKTRRLAIASCGNAALAAAVIARAADWPLGVFIPPDADAKVVSRLKDLGAAITVCPRRDDETGDPCYKAFRRAVAAGAIAFGVQGPDNGLAIEGGRTLAFEMAEQLAATKAEIEEVFVQVGGGALASALIQGLTMAAQAGILPRLPRLIAVQTAGCAPLARACQRLRGVTLTEAAQHRSRFMWPWETPPVSLAHGILDDETYDWWAIAEGIERSGGTAVVANEDTVVRASRLAREHTYIAVSPTGSAGLAGLSGIAACPAAVIFSGVER
ncbi:pyridoxal-phosphate dependent enzyme [Telmatospirillum sp.]|uniref:pyridoxal-phosphate dependent enzyme n=1 Tax=Telmatospirillum sp. TaxID=2079197 RepID=UPI0028401547|nr:pyridoxal-phosphate dependent enzyme [Telmatospirillum sp.]MDR3439414.1 pyridoxal-phosphate dependent enzyme [Telmatospirillum sp.]